MQRRRIAVAAAVVAAAGAAVAFTLPSMAETTPSATKAASNGDVSPQILAAMRRDLGVDDAQARTMLERAKWASKVSAKLSAQTGTDYGGAWLAADGTTLKVAVTDPDAEAVVRQAGAVPVLVKRSQQKLVKAKEKLDAVRSDAGDVTGWYVDVRTNKLVVVAKPGGTGDAKDLAEAAGVAGDAVTIRTSTSSPKPLFDTSTASPEPPFPVRGGDPYFVKVDGGTARCSIGFSVKGGFVTAGHCGAVGDTTSGFNNKAQGTVEASVFPGNADMGFVEVNGDWTPRPVVNDFQGHELPVAGSTESPVGAAICRSGSTTGTHCGTVLAKNQTVVYPEGPVTGLTRTDVCAEGGDSGGSWLSGDQAQGVTSGGSGDCTVGGETFFQPVNEILAEDKLTLVTQGGADATTPPATDPPTVAPSAEPTGPADACAGLAASVEGSVTQAGTAQAQPDDGGFRADAGPQTACLDAPDGADFDLFLQQFSGLGFKTVAKATGTGDKELTFTGRSGTYRYVVAATSGTGTYTLGFSTP